MPRPDATTAQPSSLQNEPLKGVLYMLANTVFLSAISVTVKILGERGIHPVEISFFRSAMMVLPILLILKATGKLGLIRTANIKAQIIRGAIGTLCMLLMFITYTYLPLAEAQSLFFTTPLFVILLSWPILGEKVGPYRMAATLIGFLGVLVILQPGAISSLTGAIFGILSAVGMCCVTLTLRTLGRTQDATVTIFYFAVVGMFCVLPLLPFYWTMPSLQDWGILCLVSLFALCTQFALTKALFLAPPSITAPVSYIGLLWALLMDLIIWSDAPSVLTLGGAGIVIAANIFIIYREHVNAQSDKTRIKAKSMGRL